MPRSIKSPEAKSHAAEYQQKNFSTVAASVPREKADEFRDWCKSNGTTVHAEIKKMIESKIQKAEE